MLCLNLFSDLLTISHLLSVALCHIKKFAIVTFKRK